MQECNKQPHEVRKACINDQSKSGSAKEQRTFHPYNTKHNTSEFIRITQLKLLVQTTK